VSETQRILTTAIETWKPVALVSLFSGGYDSMITTHILHRLNTHGLPVQVWAIDTQLAADGWREYVQGVASGQGWNFQIYDNKIGFREFVKLIEKFGCPYSRQGHTTVFRRLKERGFDAILKMNKRKYNDKVLFVSGMRRAESNERKGSKEVERVGKSNKIFAAPIVDWTNDECDYYRVDNNLPDNPFYKTVGGSGDCQCNWGRFITLLQLTRHSPKLAAGNVTLIHELSLRLHGYGWDGKLDDGQQELFSGYTEEAQLTSPFLCAGCSRAKHRVPARIVENRILQAGLF
jgi:3'-phosphoadenosine 5'-phosphosulfate sulfotransferase (PAPS reductase)/FAD synthetase